MATISVAMATYNGARYVVQQLQSFAAQTRPPDEVVVGDDQSTDNTVQLIHAFAETAPFPVRITVNPNRLGYRENFLRTALRCRSAYVAFSDQDDVWLPRKLEVCLDRLESTGALLCVHTATLVTADLEPIDHFPQAIFRDRVIPPLTVPLFYTYYGLCEVFLREIIEIFPVQDRPEGHDPLGEPISHDRWVTTLAAVLGSTVTVTESLVLYRQHGKNVTGQQKRVRRRDALTRIKASMQGAANDEIARLCEERAALFQNYASTHQTKWSEPAAKAAGHFRRLAASYRTRSNIFRQKNVPIRLVVLAAAVFKGTYRAPRHAGLGRNVMLKDILNVAMPGAPR